MNVIYIFHLNKILHNVIYIILNSYNVEILLYLKKIIFCALEVKDTLKYTNTNYFLPIYFFK